MSGLHHLVEKDFRISGNGNVNTMCTTIPGISLILFWSPACAYCSKLIPVFKQLPGTINGCQFGIVNVSTNRKILQASKDTTTPITFVPYVLLYVNGKPFMSYKGEHSKNEISNFIIEVSKIITNKESPASNPNVKKCPKDFISSYTTGKPLCGQDDKVCYLDFGDAYGNDNTGADGKKINKKTTPYMQQKEFNNQQQGQGRNFQMPQGSGMGR
jgi:hypothetical protein